MTEKSLDKEVQESATGKMSRRNFLNTAGSAAVGGLVAMTGASMLTGKKAAAADAPEAPALPWKYEKLDPKEAGKRGYENYLLRGG